MVYSTKAYSNPRGIDQSKYTELMNLAKKLPHGYQKSFYKNLQVNNKSTDLQTGYEE